MALVSSDVGISRWVGGMIMNGLGRMGLQGPWYPCCQQRQRSLYIVFADGSLVAIRCRIYSLVYTAIDAVLSTIPSLSGSDFNECIDW